jgi:hypothetical protein
MWSRVGTLSHYFFRNVNIAHARQTTGQAATITRVFLLLIFVTCEMVRGPTMDRQDKLQPVPKNKAGILPKIAEKFLLKDTGNVNYKYK